jgi:pimeloyl-ACP methyl ester carboxylesterase
MQLRRRFVDVGGRIVHFRRMGGGPPLVLVHGSPASSELLIEYMLALAENHTCFAFDTPGFGDSDPLLAPQLEIADLADALCDTLDAVGMPPCAVFGSHTGAAVALELALRHPSRITGLVLDGLPMFSEEEQRQLFDDYFEPLLIEDLGGHFAHVWTRFRDLFQWFPWTRCDPAHLTEADVPAPERLQRWVSMFYRAAPHYSPAYRAAIRYGSQALAAVARLRAPAVFMAQDTDMLFAHLDRLPPVADGQSIVRVTAASKTDAILAATRTVGAICTAPLDDGPTAGPRLSRRFIDLSHGQMLVHDTGPKEAPVLLYLHDVPGSSRASSTRRHSLSAGLRVLGPDLPGAGESPPLSLEPPGLAGYVDALVELVDRLGIADCAVWGEGYSSVLAAAFARRAQNRVRSIVLHGPCLPSAALRDELLHHHAEEIRIEPDGSHWYRTWLMLRDSLVRFPWFDGRRGALRRLPLPLDGPMLHEWTFEVLKQPAGWHHLIRAALRHDVGADLAALTMPVLLASDPLHPFTVFEAVACATRSRPERLSVDAEPALIAWLSRARASPD